jgi:hypothetical protein
MSVMVNGEYVALNPSKFYLVAMNEQVFNFFNAVVGGALTPLVTHTGFFEYTIVRDYMNRLKFVDYTSEGRIKDTAGSAGTGLSSLKIIDGDADFERRVN